MNLHTKDSGLFHAGQQSVVYCCLICHSDCNGGLSTRYRSVRQYVRHRR